MNRLELITQVDNIIYLAGDGNYTNVHFVDASKQMYAKTLGDFCQVLPHFIRIHKSYLINPDHISDFKHDPSKGAFIKVGVHWLPVSRRKISDVKPLIKPRVLTGGTWYYIPKSNM